MKTPIFFVESNEKCVPCPCCNGQLVYRDSRTRIRKKEGGGKCRMLIRRLKCKNCGRLHNELPDCLVPYKHYESEPISGVIDQVLPEADLETEDYPCESTVQRWRKWFSENKANMEGHMRRALYHLLDYGAFAESGISLLEDLRNRTPLWLEAILRIVFNSGGSLVSS